MKEVHFVVPDGVDDPRRPSGGNTYDRRVCGGLSALGWSVTEHAIPLAWPEPSQSSAAALATVMGALPDGAVVLLDGLSASAVPELLLPHAERLRLVVLVHMPLGHRPPPNQADQVRAREREALSSATLVVTTSVWTERRLQDLYALRPERLRVCRPGVDSGGIASGTTGGGALLCVAAVIEGKGHDLLVEALAEVADLVWECICVGPLDREANFVADLRRRVSRLGLEDRVSFPGPRVGTELGRLYTAADLVVLASRAETYGMVLTEALAHGLPVLATSVGGVPEAVGVDDDGMTPGILPPPNDTIAFGQALRAWLSDPRLRSRLRRGARERRATLAGWGSTAAAIAGVLAETVGT